MPKQKCVMLAERKACCHVPNAFMSRLGLIWPISSMEIPRVSKKNVFCQALGFSKVLKRCHTQKAIAKGPGFWKLHTSLPTSPEYVKTITSELPMGRRSKRSVKLLNKMGLVQYKIKMSSIAFSKKMSWKCRKLEEELNFKYQYALNRLQQNPSNVTKQAFENLKVNLKHCLIRKLRG